VELLPIPHEVVPLQLSEVQENFQQDMEDFSDEDGQDLERDLAIKEYNKEEEDIEDEYDTKEFEPVLPQTSCLVDMQSGEDSLLAALCSKFVGLQFS
jgi:hypothetical protein